MFKCRFCGKELHTFSEVITHFRSECKYVPKSRRCPVCGGRFKTIRLMKQHLVNSLLKDKTHQDYLIVVM